MKVIGDKLAILPDELPEKSEGGIIISADRSLGRGQNTLTIGTVKGIGHDYKYKADVKVGDKVAYREFCAHRNDGLDYTWSKDVLCVVG